MLAITTRVSSGAFVDLSEKDMFSRRARKLQKRSTFVHYPENATSSKSVEVWREIWEAERGRQVVSGAL